MKPTKFWQMHPRTRARPSLWPLVLAAVLGTGFFILPWQWLANWEGDTIDFRLRWRGVQANDFPVVLVGIDDTSFTIASRAPGEATRNPTLARMGEPWPWDRRVFAETLRQLAAAGARAVVFDVVLAAETSGDLALAKMLGSVSVPVTLAKQYVVNESLEGERSVVLIEPRAEFATARANVQTGFANIWPDEDGVVRRAHLEILPEELLGDVPPERKVGGDLSLAARCASALGRQAPVSAGLIDLSGPAGTIPMVPIENLFLPDRWSGAVLDHGRFFRDKVVVVGPFSEVRFKDYYATSLGRMTGAELQANIVASLLGKGLLRQPGRVGAGLAVGLLAVLAALLGLASANARWYLTGLCLLLIVWLAAAQAALIGAGWVLPVAAPVGALFATGAVGIASRYAREERERRRMRALLSSYVSESVAEVILRQPEGLTIALGGVRRPVTVLFSDLRGFTQLTETTPPAALVAQLNEYLHAMVDCVLAEGGTVQKFIGDALLAVWGDTHTIGVENDARRALAAALAMEAALAKLNHQWAGRPDRVPLQMGIGLHQGEVTVGNLGHPQRMEFGVLGDAVNTASRLEGATKHLGVPLIVGEPVARLVGVDRLAYMGRIIVAGRTDAVAIYTPLDEFGLAPADWIKGYAEAVTAMRTGQYAGALEAYRRLPDLGPRLRALVEFQIRRVADLSAAQSSDFDPPIRFTGK